MKIEITKRAREYGYIFWPKNRDGEISSFLGDLQNVNLIFNGEKLGEKNVDWKNRRISVGYKNTRILPKDIKSYSLVLDKPNKLKVDTSK